MDPAPSSEARVSFEETEELLRTLPNFEVVGLLPHSSNYTFLAELGDGQRRLLAVYKPVAGESPLWDFPPSSLYRREVAAYRLSRMLGWPLIPPTVVREKAPQGPGSVQAFIEGDPRNHYLRLRDRAPQAWPAVSLFDVLTNNADRKAGHCLLDSDGRVWVFDHGLTFHPQPKLRTIIWDYSGEPLPDQLRSDVKRVAGALEGGDAGELGELLTRVEMRGLKRRFNEVLAPRWRFPRPTSNWSIPWPPI